MLLVRRIFLVATVFTAVIAASPASAPAQSGQAELRDSCPGLIAAPLRPVVPVSLRLAALAAGEVRLTYAGHSTFVIESPQGVRIATDYNDYIRVPLPTIATMNRAHDTHFSDQPNPAIPHVLRGWAASNTPARHNLQVQDVHVRNVPTNIRFWSGDGTDRHGNSIFIFQVGSLCIAHLGHLHHTLTPQQLEDVGRVDVVLVPVDGSFTLDLDGMMEVLQALKAPLIVPIHYFSQLTLQRFLDRAKSQSWTVETAQDPSLVLSRATLPSGTKILVLPGH